ncbi:unnamed protein product [Orchesella dallaii]|uniref:G-protein coupled receptors family 2 profile 2 domain-containing protein n=1 Tax=Orchesella dallaii TaxID=48710 RepID=A0ABP1RW32_9HEXA
MADPTLQTFCCIQTNMTRPGADTLVRFRSGPYNAVCILFSVFGILGAIYQILPRESYQSTIKKPSTSSARGRYIIVWLATADLLASSAVLIRSISWVIGKTIVMSPTLDTYFCAVSSASIQYFYTATCLWTLFYAIDVFQVVHEDSGKPKLYHIIAWGLPAILCIVGLTILYYPDINCHARGSSAFARILPNYFFTYLPIIIVMIVNPVLYWRTSIKAEDMVVSVSGRFTHNERQHLRSLKLKFFCINLVFYICWLPNIVNAFLLWTLWDDLPRNFVLFDWYLMVSC